MYEINITWLSIINKSACWIDTDDPEQAFAGMKN